jgi:hypothetical protein
LIGFNDHTCDFAGQDPAFAVPQQLLDLEQTPCFLSGVGLNVIIKRVPGGEERGGGRRGERAGAEGGQRGREGRAGGKRGKRGKRGDEGEEGAEGERGGRGGRGDRAVCVRRDVPHPLLVRSHTLKPSNPHTLTLSHCCIVTNTTYLTPLNNVLEGREGCHGPVEVGDVQFVNRFGSCGGQAACRRG